MKNQSTTQIADLVESFVSDLEQAMQQTVHETALNLVREALGDAPAPSPRRRTSNPRKARGSSSSSNKSGSSSKSSTGKKNKKQTRRSEEEIAETTNIILAHIRANPGERLEQIGLALGTPTKGLKRPIANMVSEGVLHTEGQRRGTKYFTTKKAATKSATKTKASKANKTNEQKP